MRQVIVNNVMSLDGYYEGLERHCHKWTRLSTHTTSSGFRRQAPSCSVEPHSRDSAPTGRGSRMLQTIPAIAQRRQPWS